MKNELCALSFSELCAELSKNQDSLILYHTRPDADAVGSAFALKLLIEAHGAKAYCLCADEIPKRLRFLTDGIQESSLKSSFDGDLTGYRVISVDCGSATQLGGLFDALKPSLAIDHHGTADRFCSTYADPSAAATGEIIYDAAKAIGSKLPRHFYKCIYAAISSDTGCFRFSNATPDTHRRAAELISFGIDAADINHRLFESKTLAELRAASAATEHLTTYAGGRIAVVALSSDELSRLEIERENYDVFIDVARSLAGADVAFSVRCAPNDSSCRVSMRSCGEVDVARICAAFGGGGHIRAAGCTLDTEDVNAAVQMIVKETEKQL